MKAKPTKKQFQLELEQMASELRNEIETGVYPPLSYLPAESALAKRFRLSNKSVRKGMEKLVEEGLIEKIPRVGNRVIAQRKRVSLTLACTFSIERDFSMNRLLSDFHKLYPWIRVHTIPYSDLSHYYGYEQRSEADVFAIDSTQFQELREDGHVDMLEPLADVPGVFPFLNEAFRADGIPFVAPSIFTPIVLCYNRSHFKECGLAEPHGGWTWDDLARSAAVLSQSGNRLGFCFHLLSENRWPLFLIQSGGCFEWDGERLRDLRGTKLLEGMKLGKRIICDRSIFPFYLSENNDEINALFKEGKVSMTLTSYMGMNEFRNIGLDYDISPVPNMGEPRTLAMAIGFGMSRGSLHKEESRLLIDYFSSERAQKLIRSYTLSLPALQTVEAPVSPLVQVPSRYPLYREIMASYRLHSELNVPWRKNRILAGQLKAYWAGLLDDDELCDKLAEKLTEADSATAVPEKPGRGDTNELSSDESSEHFQVQVQV